MADDPRAEKYFQIRKTIQKLVFFMGVWPSENSGSFYRCLHYVPVTLYCNAIMIILNSIAHHLDNAKIITLNFGVIAVYLLCALKVLCLAVNVKKMMWFYETIDDLCNQFLKDGQLQKFVLNDVTVYRFFFWFHTSLCGFSGTVPLVMSMVSVMNQKIHDIHPVKYNLIIPGMYPWNASINEIVYGLHFGLESYTLMWTFYVGALVDVLFSFSLLQMTIPLRGMSHAIIHVCDGEDYGSALHRCLVQYRTLIQCRNIIENTYGPIILGVAITGPIALCSLAWQVTQMETISNFQKFRFAVHGVAKILQVFSYSWSATILKGKSEDFLRKVYSSEWYGNRGFMNTVLTMLIQRPLTIKAGHMPDVSLGMFVFVMKTTVSYYLLLQTMEQKSSQSTTN
ncbi:uncharacterized protein LOC135161603 isoform X2 [Diachasmimorpha longicaudata]|uniref:uncharacterized protein LOC135161603 isoform X2 n=1 Tax=Diachasmimorpha longicaudata TaxID=58733 RepID=UPI0030B8C407